MRSIIFIIIYVLPKFQCNDQSDFLIDYFVFKNVPFVIGFGCYNIKEKLILSKAFHRLGIRTALLHFGSDSQIFHLIASRYWKTGVFVNVGCFNGGKLNSLLSKIADYRLYDELHSWLIFADGVCLPKTVARLDESALGVSTDLVVAVSIPGGYELFDVYNPWKEGGATINITRLGVWTRSAGLNITLIQSKFTRRCNLHRLTMKASFFGSKYRSNNTSLEKYLQEITTHDNYSKFGYIILLHLSEMYNFTFQFGEVGVWLANDTLGPMSRALAKNEIQFTGSAVVITEERLRLSKFVYPAWPFRSCFIFRNPQRTHIKVREVLNPFTDTTWYATLIALGIIFALLALSLKQERYEMSGNIWSNSFLTTVGCMCQQSTHFNLDRISTRIIFIHLMIFSILSYNYYSASVVSARLKEPIFKINDSLNELGKLHLKMASEPMINFHIIFNRLSKWDRKVFYEDRWLKIPESERFMYPEKAIALVQRGGFAYHTHPDVSYSIINKVFSFHEICELMEVHPVLPAYSGLCVGYNSTFFELAKIGLSRLTEVGIRHRQVQRWTSKRPQCFEDARSMSSTDIYEFSPHLILLVIGMMMAAIIFAFEFIFAKFWNKRKRCKVKGYGLTGTNCSTTHSFVLTLCKPNK